MSKLKEFLAKAENAEPSDRPVGVEWYASVQCQVCREDVDEQKLYPNDGVLVWTCSAGHKSYMENYSSF